MHLIVKILESLLERLLPAKGRHRAVGIQSVTVPARHLASLSSPDHRPVLERRVQRRRRRVLWLAVHGIDVDPGLVHGVKVGSR